MQEMRDFQNFDLVNSPVKDSDTEILDVPILLPQTMPPRTPPFKADRQS